MVRFNGVDYFYVYNLQGDVAALIDADSTRMVEYIYDAWGNPISKTGTLAATLGTLNPFRYRGYVYDEETGLYYLRSRYYNPVWKRLINADSLAGVCGRISSHNVFSYCCNTPILSSDFSGKDAYWITDTKNVGVGSMSMGHTSLLLEDDKGEWYYFYWGPEYKPVMGKANPILEKIVIMRDVNGNISLEDLNSVLQENEKQYRYGGYCDVATLFVSDYSKSVMKAKEIVRSEDKYDVLNYNCM